MADENERLEYGFDLDNSGFKQGVDDAFNHLDKKEQQSVKNVQNAEEQKNRIVEKANQKRVLSVEEGLSEIEKLITGDVSATQNVEKQKTNIVVSETNKRSKVVQKAAQDDTKALIKAAQQSIKENVGQLLQKSYKIGKNERNQKVDLSDEIKKVSTEYSKVLKDLFNFKGYNLSDQIDKVINEVVHEARYVDNPSGLKTYAAGKAKNLAKMYSNTYKQSMESAGLYRGGTEYSNGDSLIKKSVNVNGRNVTARMLNTGATERFMHGKNLRTIWKESDEGNKRYFMANGKMYTIPNKSFLTGKGKNVVDNFYDSPGGAIHTGSPMMKDPVGNGWGSHDLRIANTGMYAPQQYNSTSAIENGTKNYDRLAGTPGLDKARQLALDAKGRMSRRDLSSHLIKLNYTKHTARLRKLQEELPNQESEFQWQEAEAQRREANSDQLMNQFKQKVIELKNNKQKATNEFYENLSKETGLAPDEVKRMMTNARDSINRQLRKAKNMITTTGSNASQAYKEAAVTSMGGYGGSGGSGGVGGSGGSNGSGGDMFGRIISILERIASTTDTIYKTLAENRIEEYYTNKEAAENKQLNLRSGIGSGRKSKDLTPEQQQEDYDRKAITYIRESFKYAKSEADFKAVENTIKDIQAGSANGYTVSEKVGKELDYYLQRASEKFGPKNEHGKPLNETELNDKRYKAAAELVNQSLRTAKSFEEISKAIDKAQSIISGQTKLEELPGKGKVQYDNALNRVQGIASGNVKAPWQTASDFKGSSNSGNKANPAVANVTNLSKAYDKLKAKVSSFFHQSDTDAKKSTQHLYDYFKSATRIASGIMISQAFYGVISAIKTGISTVAQFNSEMEQVQVSFQQLLGSGTAAKKMLYDIEDLAAETPYNVDTAVDGATKLLAYGFKAKEIVPVLRTLSDATAISGGSPEKMERLILALGQIKVKGKLAGEELRQLYEAGIPAADMLMKKMNLTRDEFDKAVRAGDISANKAISILLQGIEERFGGTAKALNKTTSGLLSNIRDSALFLGQQLFTGLQEGAKTVLSDIADRLANLRKIARSFGAGGLVNAIIPKEYQNDFRRIIGYLHVFGQALKQIFVSSGILQYLLLGFMRGLQLTIVPIASALKAIANIITSISKAGGPLKSVLSLFGTLIGINVLFGASVGMLKFIGATFKLVGMTGLIRNAGLMFEAVFLMISKGSTIAATKLAGLNGVMKFLLANPIVILLGSIVIILYQIGKHFDVLSAKAIKIGGVFGGVFQAIIFLGKGVYDVISTLIGAVVNLLDGAFGVDLNNILKPVNDMSNLTWDDFNQGTGTATDNMEDLTKATDKFLASFDEVHQISEDDSNLDDGNNQIIPGGIIDGGNNGNSGGTPPTPGGGSSGGAMPPWIAAAIAGITGGMGGIAMIIKNKLKDAKKETDEGTESILDKLKKFGLSVFPALQPASDALERLKEKIKSLGEVSVPAPLTAPLISGVVAAVALTFANWQKLWSLDVITPPALNPVPFLQSVVASVVSAFANWRTLHGLDTITAPSLNSIPFQASVTAVVAAGFALWRQLHSLDNITPPLLNSGAFLGNVQGVVNAGYGIWRQLHGLDTITPPVLSSWSFLNSMYYAVNEAKNKWAELGSLPTISLNIVDLSGIAAGLSGLGNTLYNAIISAKAKVSQAMNDLFDFNAPAIFKPSGLLPIVGTTIVAFLKTMTMGKSAIPGYATGGIIDKDQIIRAGEGNKREAIIPLESSAMAPFAKAVAYEMSGMRNGNSYNSNNSQQGNIIQVGTLIADDLSLRDFAKKVNKYISEENIRTYGSYSVGIRGAK